MESRSLHRVEDVCIESNTVWVGGFDYVMMWRVCLRGGDLFHHRPAMPSSIHDLAPELLFIIFSLAIRDVASSNKLPLPGESLLVNSEVIIEEYKRLNIIRRVGHDWNALALSHPSLWENVAASLPVHFVALVLARSKDAPLHVAWDKSYRAQALVLGQGYRISSLALHAISSEDMGQITKCHFPRLRTIRMHEAHPAATPNILFGAQNPQLEHLFLHGEGHFSQITFLRNLRVLSLQFLVVKDKALLMAVIEACANHLTHLRLRIILLSYTRSTLWIPNAPGYCQIKPSSIELPFLESLQIDGVSTEGVLGFLQNVKPRRDIPHLRVQLGDLGDVLIRDALQKTVQQDFGSEEHTGTPRVVFTIEHKQESWISI
jgi:hypothetical protein